MAARKQVDGARMAHGFDGCCADQSMPVYTYVNFGGSAQVQVACKYLESNVSRLYVGGIWKNI